MYFCENVPICTIVCAVHGFSRLGESGSHTLAYQSSGYHGNGVCIPGDLNGQELLWPVT